MRISDYYTALCVFEGSPDQAVVEAGELVEKFVDELIARLQVADELLKQLPQEGA